MNFILASTSTLPGEEFLEYLKTELEILFSQVDEILFIPFARPSGISHEEYTLKAASFFQKIGKKRGNTFLLVKTLHEHQLMTLLKDNIYAGKPYLGCSAGTNIGGLNMKTTNDMPIVYPSSFDCMGLVPFNINPHYLDPIAGLKHNGETRETRIKEFLTQNQETMVVGLREGNWLRHKDGVLRIEGSQSTRIFEYGKEPYEVETGFCF